ncbi:MlaD family protein [Nocardia sp. NPDC051756]|uniref:MlaD family protein n=1 Tax=Nocardia sp. NPDC051756 TaxID=3154751 RepID=UPI003427B33B
MLVASAAFYALPLGKSTYAAELIEAGSVQAGDDIRVAGIPVGKVTTIDLQHDNRVRMRFTVRDDVFIGDQTTLEVKMLTIVGGHYVALTSAGSSALGGTAIPADRVRLPYSLAQAFQDAIAPIRAVDGDTLRRNLAALHTSIDTSPDSLRRAGTALDSIVGILVEQNGHVSRALTVADEYLAAINTSKSLIGQLVTKLNLLQTVVIDKRAEIGEALRVTSEALARLAGLGPAWNTTLKPMAQKLADAIPEFQRLGGRLGETAADVHEMLSRLRRLVTPGGEVTVDQPAATVDAPEVCIPVPGKGC